MVDRACRIAFQEGFAKPGDRVIVTAGVPLGTPGATNMLRIAYVGDESRGFEHVGGLNVLAFDLMRSNAPRPDALGIAEIGIDRERLAIGLERLFF